MPKFRLAIAAVIASVFFCASEGTSRAAEPQSDERQMLAQSLYEQGIKLAETDAKGALKAFRQSYEIQPDFHVLYNVGKVCTKLNDAPCAIKAYEQYLKDGAAEVPAKRKKEIETELKALAKAAGTTITIKTSVKGADVQIDGVSVGKTPIDKPLVVKEGSHKVVLVQGTTPVEKTVKVTLGANETVELEPAKKEEPVAPAPVAAAPAPPPPVEAKHEAPPPPPPKPAETKSGGSFPIVPWAITGALAAGTVVTGILTVGARADYNDKREVYPITRDELDAAHSKASNLFLVTTVLGAATAVSAGVAAYFTIKAGSNKETKVGIIVGPTGIAIAGKLR